MSASIRSLPFGGRYKAGRQPEILGRSFLYVLCFLSFISTYLCSIYTLFTVLSSLYSLFFTIFLLPFFFFILLSIVLYLLSTVYLWLPILGYSSSNIHSLTLNGCHMLIAIRSSYFPPLHLHDTLNNPFLLRSLPLVNYSHSIHSFIPELTLSPRFTTLHPSLSSQCVLHTHTHTPSLKRLDTCTPFQNVRSPTKSLTHHPHLIIHPSRHPTRQTKPRSFRPYFPIFAPSHPPPHTSAPRKRHHCDHRYLPWRIL
jgi:hypothetical protein